MYTHYILIEKQKNNKINKHTNNTQCSTRERSKGEGGRGRGGITLLTATISCFVNIAKWGILSCFQFFLSIYLE